MHKDKLYLTAAIAVALLATLIIDAFGLYSFWRSGVAVRFVPASSLESAGSEKLYSPYGSRADQEAFLKLLKDNGFKADDVRSQGEALSEALRVQDFIGNQVTTSKGNAVIPSPDKGYSLLKDGIEGRALLCGAMSTITREALTLLGHKARTVQLYAGNFSESTHVLVEVLVGDRWIIIDPTFNVTYQDGSLPLGVSEVIDRLSRKGPHSVQAVFHGTRAYPANLDTYYMDWRPLFGNAYITPGPATVIGKLPPFRWWLGTKYHYIGEKTLLMAKNHNTTYFIFVVVLPLTALVLFITLLAMIRRNRTQS